MELVHVTGRRAGGESGAILLVSSVLVVAMIALAALAVDIANVWQVRRHAQNAADAAALAAAQDLPNTATAVGTAKTYAQRNFDVAAAMWVGCRDDEHLATTPDMAANDNECISFSSDSKRVRVRIPVRTVHTFFGSVVGVASFPVRAGAIAGSVVSTTDRMIPAAVSGSVGTGLICVEQGGNSTPCATRDRGRFGSLSSPRLNLFKASGGSASANTLAINYAIGLDHNIVPYASGVAVCDGQLRTPCATTNVATPAAANHLLPSSGNDVPPVTEGFITGFTASTSDFGSVTFCGRLQRPDATADNLLETQPGNCTAAGAPTTQVLGKTINGRHVYHWMNDDARARFYPEVTALGVAETHPSLAIGNPAYTNGDRRLDCFLAGYRYNDTTGVETVPDCRSVGLVFPGQEAVTDNVRDQFSTVSYNGNDGSESWAGSWTESSDDDGTPISGRITVSSGALRFSANGSTIGRWIGRTANLGGATAATLTLRANGSGASKADVTLWVSADGVNWSSLDVFNKVRAPAMQQFTYDISSHISSTTSVVLQVTATGGGGDILVFDDVDITYTRDPINPAIGPVAPIFKVGMRNDPRWAVVPLIDGFNGTNAVPVRGMWASFAYTAYVTASKVQAFDAWVFDPALIQNDPNSTEFVYGFSPRPAARLIK